MKVIIIDDQMAMHFIMRKMLYKIKETEVIGSFDEPKAAFSFLSTNQVDMVFLDINMPRENGLDFAKRLRETDATIKIVFVTSYKEYALAAFNVYAYDYIIKPITEDRLYHTVQRVIDEKNNKNLKENIDKKSLPFVEHLTKREIEVLQLISEGFANKEIAETYKLSVGTIKNHIVNIFGKLEVKNRVQAVKIAKEFSLIN